MQYHLQESLPHLSDQPSLLSDVCQPQLSVCRRDKHIEHNMRTLIWHDPQPPRIDGEKKLTKLSLGFSIAVLADY